MKNKLLLLLLIFTIVSCSKSADFGGQALDVNSEYSIVSDDVIWNIEEPVTDKPEDKEKEKPVADKPVDKEKDIDAVACKVDIKMTSAHDSKVAVHLRDSETVDSLIDGLSADHKKFILDSAAGLIAYSDNKISKNSIKDGLRLNVKDDIILKATSVHSDEVVIYAAGSADIQFTSLKAKHLIIVASGSVKLKTTSFNVENVSILVRQDADKDQSICVRETSAGSFDLSLGSPLNGAGLIISGSTSFKNTVVKSLIIGDGSAEQAWKATSIKGSDFLIANQVSGKSKTSLKMTSLNQSSVLIEELSAEASVSIKATNVKSSKLLVDNMSSGGLALKTNIGGCGDFRDSDLFLANTGAQEDIGSQCK